jgi:hypothetical protein
LSEEGFLFGLYVDGVHLITIVEESWTIHHNVNCLFAFQLAVDEIYIFKRQPSAGGYTIFLHI